MLARVFRQSSVVASRCAHVRYFVRRYRAADSGAVNHDSDVGLLFGDGARELGWTTSAYFGEGLVRTANNFGKLGTPPTHPAPDRLAWAYHGTAWVLGWLLARRAGQAWPALVQSRIGTS